MKKLILSITAVSCLVWTGCGPQGNTVVEPSNNEPTAEETQAQEEDDQMREAYESGGDQE
jgi:predicted small lipoprotein YifL